MYKFNSMRIKIISNFVIASLGVAILAFSSCKREEEVLADDICPSKDLGYIQPFALRSSNTAALSGTVNLETETLLISAEFSESIEWKVKLVGLSSKAVRNFSGTGTVVNGQFTGETDTAVFFGIETIRAELWIPCAKEPNVLFIENTGKPSLALAGSVIASFNSSASIASTYANVNESKGIKYTVTGSFETESPSPFGDTYYKFISKDASDTITEWYTGGFDVNISAFDFTVLPADASRVYLNFYIRGMEGSQAQLAISETFGLTIKKRKFNANATKDWVLQSVRLSDIGLTDPTKISQIGCSLGGSTQQINSGEIQLDYMILTIDRPLIP